MVKPMLALLAICLFSAPTTFAAQATGSPHQAMNEPILPLPESIGFQSAKLAIGKRLFFDQRLSRDNKVSCAKCHDLSKGGANSDALSTGVDGRLNAMNTPTVFNSRFNFRQSWTGKVRTLEEQVDSIVMNPLVFDTTWTDILSKLRKDTAFLGQFELAYSGGLTPANIRDALATFERSLVTPSRFDAYLNGNSKAITPQEKLGYSKFKNYGCVSCHQGTNVGGNMFQIFGVFRGGRKVSGIENSADLGRYLVTNKIEDKHVFKVPSLRNVAMTAPYFHDGSARTLEEAVDVMFDVQLGRTAPAEDKVLIIKFLKTLSGAPPAKALAQ